MATKTTPQQIGINAFFAKVLKAPVNNPRWSWGAFDESTNAVFLRLWSDQTREIDGALAILALGHDDPDVVRSRVRVAAINERKRHIEQAAAGAAVYAVMCAAVDEKVLTRQIASYDPGKLAKISQFVQHEGRTWGLVESWVSAGEASERDGAWSQEAIDIEELRRDPSLGATVRSALIEARLGQGRFRERLLRQWGRACALTGCRFEPLLRASHIKPWKDSTNEERLDSRNGLPLVANIDTLFDRGYLSFSDDGSLLFSRQLPADAKSLIATADRLRKPLNAEQREFLAHHRKERFIA